MSIGFQWKVNGRVPLPIKIPAANAGLHGEVLKSTGKPFFSILSENGTVKLFLDAVAHNIEEAAYFISKNCIKQIDLLELKSTFDGCGFKYLMPVDDGSNASRRTDTVLLFNGKSKKNTILRLYMVREPDQFGQWKIFDVERE